MRLKWDFHELNDFGKRIGNVAEFERFCKEATRELAKVFRNMLANKTPMVTGQLRGGWLGGNLAYTVKQIKNGFEVEFVNDVEYAYYVNYGHYSYNKANKGGEAYDVYNRIKVPTRWVHDDVKVSNPNKYVFGHFFVEKSILQLENSNTLENVLYKELENWFRWCVNG